LCADLKNQSGFALPKKISDATIAEIHAHISDFQQGKLIKSEDRPANDMDPDHPGLTVLTAKTFDEIALNPDNECFIDI